MSFLIPGWGWSRVLEAEEQLGRGLGGGWIYEDCQGPWPLQSGHIHFPSSVQLNIKGFYNTSATTGSIFSIFTKPHEVFLKLVIQIKPLYNISRWQIILLLWVWDIHLHLVLGVHVLVLAGAGHLALHLGAALHDADLCVIPVKREKCQAKPKSIKKTLSLRIDYLTCWGSSFSLSSW